MTDYTDHQMRCIDQHRDINVDFDWWDSAYETIISTLSKFGIKVSTRTRTYDKRGRDGKVLRDEKGNIVKGSYETPELFFSLHCQGAGAYFEAESFTVAELLQAGRELMSLPDDHDDAWLKTSEYKVAMAMRAFFETVESTFGVYSLSGNMQQILSDYTYTPSLYRETMQMDGEFNDGELDEDNASPEEMQLITDLGDWVESFQGLFQDIASAIHDVLDDVCEHLTSDDAVWETIEANDLYEPEEEDEMEEAA